LKVVSDIEGLNAASGRIEPPAQGQNRTIKK
jgi:hypothetical protein